MWAVWCVVLRPVLGTAEPQVKHRALAGRCSLCRFGSCCGVHRCCVPCGCRLAMRQRAPQGVAVDDGAGGRGRVVHAGVHGVGFASKQCTYAAPTLGVRAQTPGGDLTCRQTPCLYDNERSKAWRGQVQNAAKGWTEAPDTAPAKRIERAIQSAIQSTVQKWTMYVNERTYPAHNN